jgi:hypothetical protein
LYVCSKKEKSEFEINKVEAKFLINKINLDVNDTSKSFEYLNYADSNLNTQSNSLYLLLRFYRELTPSCPLCPYWGTPGYDGIRDKIKDTKIFLINKQRKFEITKYLTTDSNLLSNINIIDKHKESIVVTQKVLDYVDCFNNKEHDCLGSVSNDPSIFLVPNWISSLIRKEQLDTLILNVEFYSGKTLNDTLFVGGFHLPEQASN